MSTVDRIDNIGAAHMLDVAVEAEAMAADVLAGAEFSDVEMALANRLFEVSNLLQFAVIQAAPQVGDATWQ